MKLVLSLVVTLALATSTRAEDPLHHIELKGGPAFEIAGRATLDVYPVSEGMRRVVQAGSRKTIEAADYAVGVKLRTKNTSAALQEVVRQVAAQTGRPLGKFINTALEQIAPVAMLNFSRPEKKVRFVEVTWVSDRGKKDGLRIGDKLTSIDGVPTEGMLLSDFTPLVSTPLKPEEKSVLVFHGRRGPFPRTITLRMVGKPRKESDPTPESIPPSPGGTP